MIFNNKFVIFLEYYFSNQTKKCYKYHTDRRTFERAHFACSAEGGQLLIINSVEELNFINELFTKHVSPSFSGALWNDIFIGFHNWGESADWTTLDGIFLNLFSKLNIL